MKHRYHFTMYQLAFLFRKIDLVMAVKLEQQRTVTANWFKKLKKHIYGRPYSSENELVINPITEVY